MVLSAARPAPGEIVVGPWTFADAAFADAVMQIDDGTVDLYPRARDGGPPNIQQALLRFSPATGLANIGSGGRANLFQLEFTDVVATNAAGADLVFFEAFSADPFEIAVREYGGSFTPFASFAVGDFVSTSLSGPSGPGGSSLISGLPIDLSLYGLADGALVDAIQFRGLGGDPVMAAVLNGVPNPVPVPAGHLGYILINNGLSPSNSANVIDDDPNATHFFVRNVNCPGEWDDSTFPVGACSPARGAPTEVSIVNGATGEFDVTIWDTSNVTMTGGALESGGAFGLYDSAQLAMSGGSVSNIFVYDAAAVTMTSGAIASSCIDVLGEGATVALSGGNVGCLFVRAGVLTMTGGLVAGTVAVQGGTFRLEGGTAESLVTIAIGASAIITGGSVGGKVQVLGTLAMSGGSIGSLQVSRVANTATLSGGVVSETISVSGNSTMTIVGRDFRVDGSPVPYGPLVAESGDLTGTLASGDLVDNAFARVEYPDQGLGTILLVAPPSVAASSPISLAVLVLSIIVVAFGSSVLRMPARRVRSVRL